MSRINTNVSALIAQNTLARSNSDLQTSLQRLSTGLQINRGADNPAGLIVSERHCLCPATASRLSVSRWKKWGLPTSNTPRYS